MKPYLQHIDRSTTGRYDVTPLFADARAFEQLVSDLAGQAAGHNFDLVAGIDALGFILGAALAGRMGKGFLAIRKGGKLPGRKITGSFTDYTGQQKSLEIRADALRPGVRVLLVDEWIETGAQVSAAAELVERLGGVVAAIATINCDDNDKTRAIALKYPVFSADRVP